MYRYRRLLVALELNDQDTNILRYAGMISRICLSQSLCFVHVVQEPDIPADICEKYPQLTATSLDGARQKMNDRVKQHFEGHPQSEIRYDVAEGCPIRELLRCCNRHDADLVILGRASPPMHLGQLSERMARKASCSVLIVPENSKPRIGGIMVPVDFSSHSGDALEVALGLAQAGKSSRVDCLHAFRVPPNYENAGIPYEEFAEEMRKSSLRAFAALSAQYDAGEIELSSDVVLDRSPSHAIMEAIQSNRDDLVVMGARGRSAAAAVLLGNVTEHVIWTTTVPLLVVKRKGANAIFIDALLNP